MASPTGQERVSLPHLDNTKSTQGKILPDDESIQSAGDDVNIDLPQKAPKQKASTKTKHKSKLSIQAEQAIKSGSTSTDIIKALNEQSVGGSNLQIN